jgi:hypothetical protein
MVPIHDSDVGEQRWAKSEWENYELWEKVESKLKRKKRLWILATALTVISFSAIPSVMDRWPKWKTRRAARYLAQELNRLKRDASIGRAAYRLQFEPGKEFRFKVEKLKDCKATQGEFVRESHFEDYLPLEEYTIIPPDRGGSLGVPGLLRSFCYDYLMGSVIEPFPGKIAGFGIIFVKDLADRRLDRSSILLLSGPSADLSFE